MKKIILATLVAAATCSSYAAETTQLKVQGKLVAAACTPSLSDGGAVDFGDISVSALSATEVNQMGDKHITLTIECDSATKVGFTNVDTRADTDPNISVKFDNGVVLGNPDNIFGLGQTAEGVGIGSYGIRVDAGNVTIDGVVTPIIYQQKEHAPDAGWTASSGTLQDRDFRTITAGDPSTPKAFITGIFPMTVAAAIQPTQTLNMTDETALDGELTFSLVYL